MNLLRNSQIQSTFRVKLTMWALSGGGAIELHDFVFPLSPNVSGIKRKGLIREDNR